MKDTLVAAILIGLTSQSTSNDEALRLTNVEIHLTNLTESEKCLIQKVAGEVL
jgi:hypothetical protein